MIPTTISPSPDHVLADALRDAAIQVGAQWSTRQAASLALHALCCRLIAERERRERRARERRFSERERGR